MAGTFDQIAAEPDLLRRVGSKRDHRLVAEIKQLPQAEPATDVEGKASRWPGALPATRRQRLHDRRRGRRRRPASCAHRTHRERPDRDARRPARRRAAWRWRNLRATSCRCRRCGSDEMLGGDERAERRLELEAAGQLEPRVAFRFRPRMAGRAAAGMEDALAARRVACRRARRLSRRRAASASSETRMPPRRRRQAPARRRRAFAEQTHGQAFLDAIGLVAACRNSARSSRAAAPAPRRSCAGAASRSGVTCLEFVHLGLEAGHVFPDFRRGRWCRPCRCRPGTTRRRRSSGTLALSAVNAASTAAASNAVSPLAILASPPTCLPFSFMMALRSAIGSA